MKIVDYYEHETGTVCDDCGTGIKNCYVLSDGTVTMVVGSECAKRLSQSDPNVKRDISWIARIKKEWKETPAAETEAAFIVRRLRNLRGAYAAYGTLTRVLGSSEIQNRAMIKLQNERSIPQVINDSADKAKVQEGVKTYIEELLTALENKFNASRYDFVHTTQSTYYYCGYVIKKLNEVPKY